MGIARLKRALYLIILVSTFIAGTRIFYSYAETSKTQGQSPTGTVPVLQVSVQDLSSDKYFPKVKEALTKAKSSIYMMMYLVNFNEKLKNSPVNQLVDELINANNRGVKVKVILDQNINYNNLGEGSGTWEREAKNDGLFLYLKKNGIEVYFDNVFMITHSKVIIIDEETVILGKRLLVVLL